MTATPLLDINDLCAGYDAGNVLHHINLSVGRGEFVCVIGANTAGKSTLLRTISGLLPNRSGRISFDGHDLTELPAHRIPGLGIAHVPEGRHVFPGMTIEENLMLGAFSIRTSKDLGGRREQMLGIFPRLRERLSQLAGTLSGGEQQMLVLARALIMNPKLLLLDEPSHGLAPKIVDELHETLQKINATGTAILLVEQNTVLALSVATRGYVLESGEIVLAASSADLRSNDRVRTAYLGL
ncbi:MAG: ABC transporter ATP-binding protein [Afipia sp.]|nr:ABC transporter ATP-binding protein [Afipia sp.]